MTTLTSVLMCRYVGVRYIYFLKYSYTPGDQLINSSGRTIRTIAKYMHYVERNTYAAKRQNNETVGSNPQQYSAGRPF